MVISAKGLEKFWNANSFIRGSQDDLPVLSGFCYFPEIRVMYMKSVKFTFKLIVCHWIAILKFSIFQNCCSFCILY